MSDRLRDFFEEFDEDPPYIDPFLYVNAIQYLYDYVAAYAPTPEAKEELAEDVIRILREEEFDA